MSASAAVAATTILESLSTYQPAAMTFRRTQRTAAVAQSYQPVDRPVSPETRLWTFILMALYTDIAREGRWGAAHRDAIREQKELEVIADGLGLPAGAIERLVESAISAWEKGRKS